MAALIAFAVSAVFQGLTMRDPLSECAAPANSERMRTPWRFSWQAMYSYETCRLSISIRACRRRTWNAPSSSRHESR